MTRVAYVSSPREVAHLGEFALVLLLLLLGLLDRPMTSMTANLENNFNFLRCRRRYFSAGHSSWRDDAAWGAQQQQQQPRNLHPR
jgi:hypothetical protein